jgi:hypothetical protein
MGAISRKSVAGDRVVRRVEPDGELAIERKQIVATTRWVRAIEEWAKRQPGRAPTFSEAVRILVEKGLQADEPR